MKGGEVTPVSRSHALNVLLIVMDSARADRFGCYGYHRPTTPSVDRLAERGVVFEQMITSSSWTLPSHASLFTGLYPREHGADYPEMKMRTGPLLLDRHLREHGYETIFVSNNPLVSKRTGIVGSESRVLLPGDVARRGRARWLQRAKVVLGSSDRGSGMTTDLVTGLLAELPRPFFIFINYMESHWRYLSPRSFERRFVRRRFSPIDSAAFRIRARRRFSWENARLDDGDDLELLSDLYDASLACVDDRVGRLLGALEASGQAERTVVVVTADHGEMLGEHELSGHAMSLYQPLLRVPFIVRSPGMGASRAPGLVQMTDVFAGLCGLLGVEVPEPLQGRPFALDPSWLGSARGGRTVAFSEWHSAEGSDLARRLRKSRFPAPPSLEAAQDGRYKLMVETDSSQETLHDLQTDPGEARNLTADLPAERERLRRALAAWRADFQPQGTLQGYTAEEERALEGRLKELGYI